MNNRDDALDQVERLITEGKKRVARQREVVANAFQEGRDTEVPVSMLRAFEASLQTFERHRQFVLDRQKKGETTMTTSGQKPHHDLRCQGRRHNVVEFKTANGEALAISIPRSQAHVIRYFQERMPYGECRRR